MPSVIAHRFEHASTFPGTGEGFFAWHEDAAIVCRLIPPWERIRLLKLLESLQPGTTAAFENRLGPFRFRWEVVHREYDPPRLCSDEQVRGPGVNREEPRMAEDERKHDDGFLAIGDAGCLYFSIDKCGQIIAGESCY